VRDGLKGLKGVLAKAAAAHGRRPAGEARNAGRLDPDQSSLLKARLFPDMFPLLRQVQIATDFAKGCAARLAGEEVPAWDDAETDFAGLIARVDRAVAYVEGLDPAKFENAEDRDITLTRRGETSVVKGLAYLQTQAQPNFFFHLTTAYAILRKNGVEIGKKDYLGTA
jgi:hypothetical protein